MPTAQSLTYAALDVGTAISAYAEERRAQVSKRMAAYWMENARPLTAFFNDTKLRHITPAQLAAYQNARTDAGRAPKTINGELSVLRQILKRAKLWYRFSDEYTTLRNRKPPVGRALTADEQHRLFALAPPSRPGCMPTSPARSRSTAACVRATSKCSAGRTSIRPTVCCTYAGSKTPAGWRSPTLNTTCLEVLGELHDRAAQLGFVEPDHFVFPWHGRNKRLDPTKPMTSWRTAWRAMRKAAGLTGVRFHDGRHTAITTLAEKGLADWVIQAQVGHVAPTMMKTYSHIRRQALNEAADALEPTAKPAPTPSPTPAAARASARVPRVTSQSTSQSARRTGRVLSDLLRNLAPQVGLEPTTLRLTAGYT